MSEKGEMGATDMLRHVVGSLRMYPDGGGDVGVMTEVDRIRQEAREQGRQAQAEQDAQIVCPACRGAYGAALKEVKLAPILEEQRWVHGQGAGRIICAAEKIRRSLAQPAASVPSHRRIHGHAADTISDKWYGRNDVSAGSREGQPDGYTIEEAIDNLASTVDEFQFGTIRRREFDERIEEDVAGLRTAAKRPTESPLTSLERAAKWLREMADKPKWKGGEGSHALIH